jgi:hypothetical protein
MRTSEEQDDPAVTLAMNYIEDDVPLSSDSLENKGMRRKAAAAAHDIATLLASLGKRVDAWKDKVRLFSRCLECALETLFQHLQGLIRQQLKSGGQGQGNSNVSMNLRMLLCPQTVTKLFDIFDELASADLYKSHVALLGGDCSGIENVFLSLRLYQGSVETWGECTPFLFPTNTSRCDLLQSLCDSACSFEGEDREISDLVVFPSSTLETRMHRLQVVCHRFCVFDILDGFVSRPIPFHCETDSHASDHRMTSGYRELDSSPFCASKIVEMLDSAMQIIPKAKREVWSLHSAICHRIHSRILLLDGLFTSTEIGGNTSRPQARNSSSPTGDLVLISKEPSFDFQFDPSKCADSIAIQSTSIESFSSSSGGVGSCVNQRASKVWGSVLSTKSFRPKSGVHKWAVRLDKCERGHVFIGVSTSQANTRTYVGGDRYGWGMIGTQALWHDRRKIRGDYGSTFRTGSIIIVSLDTDAGTLSFASWKDDQKTVSLAYDGAARNLEGPRSQSQAEGVVEDWGVAFEGLPLDSRLYPAMGLYQRDDCVSLLTLESEARASARRSVSSGECFFPSPLNSVTRPDETLLKLRAFNERLVEDAVDYTAQVFQKVGHGLSEKSNHYLQEIMPALAAVLCLSPSSVPVLSIRSALTLLPHLSRCIRAFNDCATHSTSHNLFPCALKDGAWVIRATSGSSDLEEYIVQFHSQLDKHGRCIGFKGEGEGTTGKSKNGIVDISGSMTGSSLTFVEKWSDQHNRTHSIPRTDDSSSCVVAARVGLGCCRFEGTYRNVEFGTEGQIAGIRSGTKQTESFRLKDVPTQKDSPAAFGELVTSGKVILCHAYSHLLSIIAEDIPGDHSEVVGGAVSAFSGSREEFDFVMDALGRPFMSKSMLCTDQLGTHALIKQLNDVYFPCDLDASLCGISRNALLKRAFKDGSSPDTVYVQAPKDLMELVSIVDDCFAANSGGLGSLRSFCPEQYLSTRRYVVAAIVFHCGLVGELHRCNPSDKMPAFFQPIWKEALRVLEDGTREAIANSPSDRRSACVDFLNLCQESACFLLGLGCHPCSQSASDTVKDVSWFFRRVKSAAYLESVRYHMCCASNRALLRVIVIEDLASLLRENANRVDVALDSIVACLPNLLGHGRAKVHPSTKKKNWNLDGHCLADVSGANLIFRSEIMVGVSSIFRTLVEVLDGTAIGKQSNQGIETKVMVDSFVLSVLATFVGSLRDKFDSLGSDVLNVLKKLLSWHRSAIFEDDSNLESFTGQQIVRFIHSVAQRDLSRVVLSFSVTAVHLILYQLLASTEKVTIESSEGDDCLEWFFSELGDVFPAVELARGEALSAVTAGLAKEELERWHERTISSERSMQKQEAKKAVALMYLRDHGTAICSTVRPVPRLLSDQRTTTRPAKEALKDSDLFEMNYLSHFLTQWLHILSTITRSRPSAWNVSAVRDRRWHFLLFKAVGLDLEQGPIFATSIQQKKTRNGALPARHRARIIFFLLGLLENADPSDIMIEGLFMLAGSEVVDLGLDSFEALVSREAVSLLRALFSPHRPNWRLSIMKVIKSILFHESAVKKAGVFAFFNGSIRGIHPLSRVLLKPSSAMPLSYIQQSASTSSKSAGSGTTRSAPVGTDSIAAGLLRCGGDAGIVSNIDVKSGFCEVVLVARQCWSAHSNVVEREHIVNGRHALSVRALRAPLADVAVAEEVALVFGKDSQHFAEFLGMLLSDSVESLLSATVPKRKDEPESKIDSSTGGCTSGQLESSVLLFTASKLPSSEVSPLEADMCSELAHNATSSIETRADLERNTSGGLRMMADLMAIKCCISLLSDEELLVAFLEKRDSCISLAKVLSLAWPEHLDKAGNSDLVRQVLSDSLAATPAREARLIRFVELLNDLNNRENAIASLHEDSWSTVLQSVHGDMAVRLEDSAKAPQAQPRSSIATSTISLTPDDRLRELDSTSNRSMSQSTRGSNSDEDDDQSRTGGVYLLEAAIAQMTELGIPRSYSEFALRRTGGSNIEAAVHFCLENGADIERLLAEDSESRGNRSSHRGLLPLDDSHLLRQLMEMGFPRRWCTEALSATSNNVDDALTWILNNNETLERLNDLEEGEEVDNIDDDDDDDSDEDSDNNNTGDIEASAENRETEGENESDADQENESSNVNEEEVDRMTTESSEMRRVSKLKALVCPLKVISGRANIDPHNSSVSGLANGGFASVGVRGLLLKAGCWYYEAVLGTSGCIQLGFGDSSFASHCNADRGDGCGDASSSFSFDGWRRLRWHGAATEWGCRWKEGDVVGCFLDVDTRKISFSLNGQKEEIGMGLAFKDIQFCGGLFPVVSFNRREKVRILLGGEGQSFRFPPPPGYRGVGEAVLESVMERRTWLENERLLDDPDVPIARKLLCDFSEEDHGHELFSWCHRYYGSDASVHLGSPRPKHSIPSIVAHSDDSPILTGRIEKVWNSNDRATDPRTSVEDITKEMLEGYERVRREMVLEAFNESVALAVMLSRKLLLHILVSAKHFDLAIFATEISNKSLVSQKLWRVLEACLSTRGWSGEAGTMAIAAEALGLGIQMQSRTGNSSFVDLGTQLPICGFTQVLSNVQEFRCTDRNVAFYDTSKSFASSAEAAFGSDGGGAILAFVREGIQRAACSSRSFRSVLAQSVNRYVRVLAVVDDGALEGSTKESTRRQSIPEKSESHSDVETMPFQPDARLASFLTGVLLSTSVQACTEESEDLHESLLGAWSIGFLSASIPWRMVCSLTAAGILNSKPSALSKVLSRSTTLSALYGRLESTVARRIWAERAAYPVCSRYVQAIVELLVAVRRAVDIEYGMPEDVFNSLWRKVRLEAACPRSGSIQTKAPESPDSDPFWEQNQGWLPNEEVWSGELVCHEVDWMKPHRSGARSLTEGGEGPPMLRTGCWVMRGPDWDSAIDDDGRECYESAKAKRELALSLEEESFNERKEESSLITTEGAPVDGEEQASKKSEAKLSRRNRQKKVLRKKLPPVKLPVGIVVSIEAWRGQPGLGRKVRWSLTGKEAIYRFGGDGGRFDVIHVDTNKAATRVTKRHTIPETAEQCAARRGFGVRKAYSVLVRIKRQEPYSSNGRTTGMMELPDFGAAIEVVLSRSPNGSIILEEQSLVYGSNDSGWEARFGQASYLPGTTFELAVDTSKGASESLTSFYERRVGKTEFVVSNLRNPGNGNSVSATSELRLIIGRRNSTCSPRVFPPPPPLTFDRDFHASNLAVSSDGSTVTCSTSDGRGTAFASIGFAKGVHYWEVKLEQADIGSVFIGCAEKPPSDGPPRLSKWHGWGFVNFRATYSNGSERVYGVHAHSGDTIGVLLDCDAGRMSFFYDGLKYGEHILSDLGCAFENLSPFGFSVEGCGTGGGGQSASNGFARVPAQGFEKPRTLWPVIGLRNQGDRVTFLPKWSTWYGVDGVTVLRNVLAVEEFLSRYTSNCLPDWFIEEAMCEYTEWKEGYRAQVSTRGSGYGKVEMDTSPTGCAAACAALGMKFVLLPGDRFRLRRSSGRLLELAEEAIIVGQNQLRLFYKIVSQKNEGQSLAEGAALPHWLHECDVVDDIDYVTPGKGRGVVLPTLNRFKCPSPNGLRIVFENGAVLRSDLEINDSSRNLGTIPQNTIIPRRNVLECRVNSCGVVRYRVKYEDVEGYISATIRGGNEEPILHPVESGTATDKFEDFDDFRADSVTSFDTPYECAISWYNSWKSGDDHKLEERVSLEVNGIEEFMEMVSNSRIDGLSQLASDSLLVRCVNHICNFSQEGDATEVPFRDVASALSFAWGTINPNHSFPNFEGANVEAKQATASILSQINDKNKVPPLKSVLARVALLKTFNRRVQYALPWLPMRPCQEGSAILGGMCGYGATTDRAGRVQLLETQAAMTWVQVPSIATHLRSLRGLIFSSVKRGFLESVTEATATPTPLSHDEYELPREIRTVRINRLKAARAMDLDGAVIKRKHSVFAQLQNETKSWGGAGLRRSYVAKGHGGQKRAFKVKFIGEGVNDYSGPYREVYTDAFNELLKVDPLNRGTLGVLDPTPNNAEAIGENRELLMFSLNGQDVNSIKSAVFDTDISEKEQRLRSSFLSVLASRNETTREVEESLMFLGRLTGTAYRHNIAVDLPLPMETVWKAIVEELSSETNRLNEIDYLAARQLQDSTDPSVLLWWQQRMLNSFVEGLANVIPYEILPIFSGEELRDVLCGNPEVEVDLLRRVVEYEGYEVSDPVVGYFWETLRSMTDRERKTFLQFVWARSRLPMRESDFEAPFKLQKDLVNVGEKADLALPSASTCFFSLTLPEYSNAALLRDKLLYAINNVTTMETDFQTNSAEIAEGYRAL